MSIRAVFCFGAIAIIPIMQAFVYFDKLFLSCYYCFEIEILKGGGVTMSATDRDTLKALTVLFKSSQHVQDKLKKDMMKQGLNFSEFAVMELLYHKGEQPIQNIGKKVLLASSSLTYVVDKLESKGLVQRIPCATDRRVIFTAITEEGRKLMDRIFPLHAAYIADIFSVLSDKEVETFIDLAKRVGLHSENLEH